MQSKTKRQKLILTGILLMLLFTYPVITVASKKVTVWGVPLLYLYVLLVWVIGIIVLYTIAGTKQKRTDE